MTPTTTTPTTLAPLAPTAQLPITAASVRTPSQRRSVGWKVYTEQGTTYRIKAELRFDDECRNGHNTFSITGTIERKGGNGKWYDSAGGCIHDQIAEHFPELAPFIRWHLCSTDGPLHYLANTVYLAGDRDYNGLLKGEPNRRHIDTFVRFGANPILHKLGNKFARFLKDAQAGGFDLEVLAIEHLTDSKTYRPKYTFGGFADRWHECPFNTESAALNFLQALKTCNPEWVEQVAAWGEGKARELDAARRAAMWPEATDAELCQPADELRAALTARLPGLLADFRQAMEALGFAW